MRFAKGCDYTSASHPARNVDVRGPRASRLIRVTRHCDVTACRVPGLLSAKRPKTSGKPKFNFKVSAICDFASRMTPPFFYSQPNSNLC